MISYPAYKDSGVPWLGDVPAHWDVLPGRACYREKKVPNTGLKETTVLSLSYGQFVVKPPEKLHGLVPASFETYQIVDPGDIIIRPTDLQNDWNSLRFGLSRHRGIITSAYMCFHTQDALNPRIWTFAAPYLRPYEGILWPGVWIAPKPGLEGLQVSPLSCTFSRRTTRHRRLP